MGKDLNKKSGTRKPCGRVVVQNFSKGKNKKHFGGETFGGRKGGVIGVRGRGEEKCITIQKKEEIYKIEGGKG